MSRHVIDITHAIEVKPLSTTSPRRLHTAPESPAAAQMQWLDNQHESPPDSPHEQAGSSTSTPAPPPAPGPAPAPPRLGPPPETGTRALLRDVGFCLLWCCIYFGTGSAFYMSMQGWSFVESVYFLMVTASTVGYGDLKPDASVPGSRFFTLCYILFGIGVVFAQLSALIARSIQPLYYSSRETLERWFPQQGIDIDGDGTEDFKVPRKPLYYYSKNLVAPLIVITGIQCFFAAIFCAIEGWDFGTALYHCLVTMTTVGFGDVDIQDNAGRMWAFFHIVISVSLLAASLADVGMLQENRKAALRKMDMVKGSLDVDLMLSLDKDGNGVDKFEFVIGMLTMLDAVKQEDVDMFVKLFEMLDKDGSGMLDGDDIRAGLEDRQKQFNMMQSEYEAGFNLDDGGTVDGAANLAVGALGMMGSTLGSGPKALGIHQLPKLPMGGSFTLSASGTPRATGSENPSAPPSPPSPSAAGQARLSKRRTSV